MSYKIVNMFVPSSKYRIKAPYAMNPTTLTVHETGNNATARGEVAYMRGNNNMTSYHVAIDDKEAVQAIPFNRNAWAAGDGANGQGNRKSIHLEICFNKDNGFGGAMSPRMLKAIDNAALYAAHVLKQYNWGTDRLRQHWNWSRKNCPMKIRNQGKWNWFVKKVQANLDALNGKKSTPKPSAPAKKTTPKATGSTYTVKSGDSLWAIAKANKTTVAKLKSLNNLKSDTIKVGQKIKVSGAASKPAPAKKAFDKKARRGRSTTAHYSGTIDNLGAEVRKRTGSSKVGFKFTTKAGYSLKPGAKVFIFEVHNGWGRIYTGRQTGKGSNEWVYLDRVRV